MCIVSVPEENGFLSQLGALEDEIEGGTHGFGTGGGAEFEPLGLG